MLNEAIEPGRAHQLLPADATEHLAKPKVFRVGYLRQPMGARTFVTEVDARPLAKLLADAAKGQRVYELLSIQRPGDILHYLWVTVPDRSSALAGHVIYQHKANPENLFADQIGEVCEMRFVEFDRCFPLLGDDTAADADLWRTYVNTQEWRQYPAELLGLVKLAQMALRHWDDYLVQREIDRMGRGQHHLDFLAQVPRFCRIEPLEPIKPTMSQVTAEAPIPPELFELIVRLARQPDVQSVSCPFQDYWLWRELVAEQVRRSIALAVEPQVALRLNGPDSGIPFVSNYWLRPDLEWGGEVHIPYEGTCGGDLFIHPSWFGFMHNAARIAPTLSQAVFGSPGAVGFKTCKYLLTRAKKLGEIACATRMEVGDWILYTATTPQPIENVND